MEDFKLVTLNVLGWSELFGGDNDVRCSSRDRIFPRQECSDVQMFAKGNSESIFKCFISHHLQNNFKFYNKWSLKVNRVSRTGHYLVETGIPRILVLSGPKFGNFCWSWSELALDFWKFPDLIRSGPDRSGPIVFGTWIPDWT